MDNEWHKMFDGMFGVFTFSDNDDELPFQKQEFPAFSVSKMYPLGCHLVYHWSTRKNYTLR